MTAARAPVRTRPWPRAGERAFVIDTRQNQLEKTIPGFGYNAVGIALDEVRHRVFVSNMQGQLIVVDTQTLEILHTLEIEADQLLNLVYDAATNRLFGVDQGIDRDRWRDMHLGKSYERRSAGHRVFVLDADTGKTLAEMPTDEVPIGLRYDGERQRLYVTNRGGIRVDAGAGTLTIYDTAGYTLLETISLPPHPNSMALGAGGEALSSPSRTMATARKPANRKALRASICVDGARGWKPLRQAQRAPNLPRGTISGVPETGSSITTQGSEKTCSTSSAFTMAAGSPPPRQPHPAWR